MASPRGINSEGLRRRGFSAERIMMIKKAYRLLYKSGLRLNEATESLIDLANGENDVLRMVDFIQESKRSIVR